jgi:hypothetical protein
MQPQSTLKTAPSATNCWNAKTTSEQMESRRAQATGRPKRAQYPLTPVRAKNLKNKCDPECSSESETLPRRSMETETQSEQSEEQWRTDEPMPLQQQRPTPNEEPSGHRP